MRRMNDVGEENVASGCFGYESQNFFYFHPPEGFGLRGAPTALGSTLVLFLAMLW